MACPIKYRKIDRVEYYVDGMKIVLLNFPDPVLCRQCALAYIKDYGGLHPPTLVREFVDCAG